MTLLQKIFNLYKEEGETPLERITRFRKENAVLEDIPMSYWGRLDPLAKGVLIVAVGDTVSNRKEHLDMDKEYKFKVLLGFETDTHDPLGLVLRRRENKPDKKKIEKIPSIMRSLSTIKYPLYSSKTVGGEPLFVKARRGEMEPSQAPDRAIKIYDFEINSLEEISGKDILETAVAKIKKVKGDFRQAESIDSWKQNQKEGFEEKFTILSCRATVSSGTYIRMIAHMIGEYLKTGGIAFEIVRTRVGNYSIEDSLR